MISRGLLLATMLAVGLLPGCRSAYYGAWERVGVHKRDILRDRVEEGSEAQAEASEQFRTTYERLVEVAGVSGGEIEKAYNRANGAFEDSEARAAEVSERIDAIDEVAADLFQEWEGELGLIENRSLRSASAGQLRDTKKRYATLIGAMRKAESKMDPVLTAFRDQVLFLKHNLNARAIAALEGTVGEIRGDVDALIAEMENSIRESQRFLKTLDG